MSEPTLRSDISILVNPFLFYKIRSTRNDMPNPSVVTPSVQFTNQLYWTRLTIGPEPLFITI